MSEMEKRGSRFRLAALEAPHQLGKVERAGGILKGMLKRVVVADTVMGMLEMMTALTECLNSKNALSTVEGFSPCQWVLGRNPKREQDELDNEDALLNDPDPQSTFNRRGAMRESSKIAWAMEDSRRRLRSAMLRKGGSTEETFRQGDMVSFRRRQRTGGWIGPARVLAVEGKNAWLLHSGIPILVSTNRIRGANAEEHLEAELLQKSRLSRKRPFLEREAVQQPHRLGEGGQQPYVDLRSSAPASSPTGMGEDWKRIKSSDGEGDEEGRREAQEAPTTVVGGAPAEPQATTGPSETAPRNPGAEEVKPTPRAEDCPIPDDLGDLLDAEVEQAAGVVTPAPQDPIRTPLAKAMAIDGGNSSKVMKSEPSAAELTMGRTRSRSPLSKEPSGEGNLALAQEFVCFVAKRKVQGDNRGIDFGRASEEMQAKLIETRRKEWGNWCKYNATRTPTEGEVQQLLASGEREQFL